MTYRIERRHLRAVILVGTIMLLTAASVALTRDREHPIDRAELTGIWEAVEVNPMRLFVIELHPAPAASFVAMVSSEVFMFSVTSISVNGSRVEILCSGKGTADHLALKISGVGWAAAGEGLLDTTFALTDSKEKGARRTWHLQLINYKGNLIESFLEMKKRAAEGIVTQKRR